MKIFARTLIGMLCLFTNIAFAADTPPEAKPEETLAITSIAYLDKMQIPVLYTCDGKDTSPGLTWTTVPPKTASFAIIMKDEDAPFYHWVLYNIPKSQAELASGAALPAGASAGKNSFGKNVYSGPCPPKGTAHTYVITLYALDSTLKLPADADAKRVLDAMKKHIVGQIDLTGTYSRWIQ